LQLKGGAMEFNHVPGNDRGRVVLYALSTCMWCKKTKKLLNELAVDYYYVDVDLLPSDQKEDAKKEAIKWKKQANYPLIVIDDEKCIPIYSEEMIKKELG